MQQFATTLKVSQEQKLTKQVLDSLSKAIVLMNEMPDMVVDKTDIEDNLLAFAGAVQKKIRTRSNSEEMENELDSTFAKLSLCLEEGRDKLIAIFNNIGHQSDFSINDDEDSAFMRAIINSDISERRVKTSDAMVLYSNFEYFITKDIIVPLTKLVRIIDEAQTKSSR